MHHIRVPKSNAQVNPGIRFYSSIPFWIYSTELATIADPLLLTTQIDSSKALCHITVELTLH